MSISNMNASINILQASLWNTDFGEADRDAYEVLVKHSIEVLPASIVQKIQMSDELKKEWEISIFRQIRNNTLCNYVQKNLPITVPYVILKGTEAAKYYPHPEYRSLGDIDIMTKRENFDQAFKELVDGGFVLCQELRREIAFVKDGVVVELHRCFASLNDPDKAQYMDDIIIKNINSSHSLPDEVNGLVLLEHINQHLEKGLGLRQIIDWMMFVDKCLPDEKWESFRIHAEAIGLDKLAIAVTKMCEIYLGLPHRQWCNDANKKLCDQLMEYILACGNFGRMQGENISVGQNVFYWGRTPKSMLALLQDRGMANWKAAQKSALLKPFAWLYQVFRYVVKGLNRSEVYGKTKEEYRSAKQRNKMFKALGVKQASKGLAVYKDGRYIKG